MQAPEEQANEVRERWQKRFDKSLAMFDEGVEELVRDLTERGDEILIDGKIDPAQLLPPVLLASMLPKQDLAVMYVALTAREAQRRVAT